MNPRSSKPFINTMRTLGSPSGSTVAKILSRTRNDVRSKCGASAASGNANASRRTSATFTPNLAFAWNAKSQYAGLAREAKRAG